jgi:hypothetical protein
MATNGNSGLIHITTIDSFPLSTTIAGTVTIANTETAVVGVGTTFLATIGGGNSNDLSIPNKNISLGYLFDATNGEWRNIVSVLSDTILYIDKVFTNSLAGAVVRHIPASRVMSLAYTDLGTGTGTCDGVTLAAGEGGAFEVVEFTNPPITPHIFTNVDLTYSYS